MRRDPSQVAILILIHWLAGIVKAEQFILVPVSLLRQDLKYGCVLDKGHIPTAIFQTLECAYVAKEWLSGGAATAWAQLTQFGEGHWICTGDTTAREETGHSFLKRTAGLRQLTEEQANGDDPACRPSQACVAGLLAFELVQLEVCSLLYHSHSVVVGLWMFH